MSSETRPAYLRIPKRPVVDENGHVHPSCTAAAVAHGLSLGGAWARARLQRSGWRFADEAPRQPVAPSSRRGG